VWIRKNLVWSKIFCFVFVETKTILLKTRLFNYVTLVPGLYLAHCEKRERRGGEGKKRRKKNKKGLDAVPPLLFLKLQN